MGSSTHGQGIPQRPGLASSRSARAVRERIREKHADIREAVHIRPLGPGRALVKNRGSAVEYAVDNPTGKTFSPGAAVKLGSNTGHPGEFIIGGAPAKSGRAVPFAVRSVRLAPYSSVVPRYYAFTSGTGSLIASIYSDAGAWIEDRDSLVYGGTLTPETINNAFIRSDEGGTVGAASLAWRSEDNELTAWDVEAGTSYAYTATLGAFVSAPVYHDGWLYWFEVPASASGGSWPAWLLRARCDLDGGTVETVASFTATADLDSINFDGPDTIRVMATDTAILCSAGGIDAIGGEVEGWILCRCEWDGSSAAAYAGGPSETPSHPSVGLSLGLPSLAGDAMGFGLDGSDPSLRGVVDDVDSLAAEDRWPNTGSWAASSAYNAGFSADRATATFYVSDPDFAATMLEAAYNATSGEPTARVSIANHPTEGVPPLLLHLIA